MNVVVYTLKIQVMNMMTGNERNISNLNNRIQKNIFNWFNQAERIRHERIPKQLMDSALRGTSCKGRPE
jgi:hypothetical protein